MGADWGGDWGQVVNDKLWSPSVVLGPLKMLGIHAPPVHRHGELDVIHEKYPNFSPMDESTITV